MLRVKGKVTAGYVFQEADLVSDPENHRLAITTTKDPRELGH